MPSPPRMTRSGTPATVRLMNDPASGRAVDGQKATGSRRSTFSNSASSRAGEQ